MPRLRFLRLGDAGAVHECKIAYVSYLSNITAQAASRILWTGSRGWPPAVSRARHFVPVDNNRAASVSEGTMRQSFSSVRPETAEEPALRPQGPAVERIAGWSATHRKTAVIGWLLLVAAVFVGGRMVSSTNVPSYDAGQSGRAEQILNRLNVTFPPADPRDSDVILARALARAQLTGSSPSNRPAR